MEKNLFKEALKKKYRYTYRGTISTEDLFDLPVEALDSIYVAIRKQIKQEDESLLKEKTEKDEVLSNMAEIVKEIIADKQLAKEKAEKAIATRERNRRILEIIADKESEELKGKSLDDLKKMLEEDGE